MRRSARGFGGAMEWRDKGRNRWSPWNGWTRDGIDGRHGMATNETKRSCDAIATQRTKGEGQDVGRLLAGVGRFFYGSLLCSLRGWGGVFSRRRTVGDGGWDFLTENRRGRGWDFLTENRRGRGLGFPDGRASGTGRDRGVVRELALSSV